MSNERSYADYAAETNAKVLATITPNQAWVDYFRAIKAIWQPAYGDWPTDAMLTAAVMLAAKQGRPGIECWHIALCLRPKGCEVAQYTSSATSSGITGRAVDRKSTRLNSSHGYISYAVFC